MSVRNGDQSELNRDRELLERAAKTFKSRETIIRAHPRSVWA